MKLNMIIYIGKCNLCSFLNFINLVYREIRNLFCLNLNNFENIFKCYCL